MSDVFRLIDEHLSKHPVDRWEGNFREYLSLAIEHPEWSQSAHSRIYNMIRSHGVEVDETEGREIYHFFRQHLFGIDDAIAQVMEYFKSAALGADVRRRILLLYGPPASGKSELVTLIKRGLEEYSRTPEGALFAIATCPQHEDPMHLIPHSLRPHFRDEYGIHIEGELCPRCALDLETEYEGDIYRVPVKRIVISERDRVGIGTFVPSDPKTQDISELVGSMDLATVGKYGAESDPRAYRFDGELNVANRGLMEFIEMLKADEKFLYVLLTLAQERNIKTGRFPLIYADECVVSHTNETEFREFMADEKSEALRDRMITVRIPYNVRVDDEVRIYEKLLNQMPRRDVHFAPHTLKVAAMFAVLSRLEEPERADLTRMMKMKLYNGEEVEGFTAKDAKRLKAEATREGMDGLSPRFIINRLSSSLIRANNRCITPIDALRTLKEGVENHPALDAKEREDLIGLIADVRKEYDEMARTDVQKAFFVSFETEINTLLENYLDHVEAHLEDRMLTDPLTGEEHPPDERLMRSVEEKVGISERGKEAFRNEVFRKVAIAQRRGEKFDYSTHEKLREALERQLFEERRDTIKLTVSARNPDEEQLKRLNQVIDTLVQREGYCTSCANELLKYVSSLMAREK